jgi:hypothetical protein
MLKKSSNSVLDLFTRVYHLYTHLQSESNKEINIETIGHALQIDDSPLRTSLFFQSDNNGGVAIKKYAHAEGEERLIDVEWFVMTDMPGIEDYIIASFEL